MASVAGTNHQSDLDAGTGPVQLDQRHHHNLLLLQRQSQTARGHHPSPLRCTIPKSTPAETTAVESDYCPCSERRGGAIRNALIGNLVLLLVWHVLHFIVSLWYCALGIAHVLEGYIISSGLLKRYKALNLDRLQYLAVVVDSEEAHQTSKITDLLRWLTAIGVKNVCLYDTDGVLKKSKEAILERLHVAKLSEGATKKVPLLEQKHMNIEFASYSDGKETMAKAANLLFVKYYLSRDQKETIFTESHIAEALGTVGSGGPDPDLLLIYGPARCHLGFPAWRIRYTEIVHMGSLKSMKYGSLRKAMKKFTMVRQNYGK